MDRLIRGFVTGAMTVSFALLLSCEDDPFRDAPRVEASSSSPAQTRAPTLEGSAGPGPVSGMELPPGHPPIGEVAQGDGQEGAARVAAYGSGGPIRWSAPASWEQRPRANEMRYAEYGLPGGIEMVVFYFGPDGAGGVDANLQRWASQFEGGPEPIVEERMVGQMVVHTFDGRGSYDSGMAMGGGQPLADQRMLGAIAEAEVGAFFFRVVGPARAVEAQEEAFWAFVGSLEHGDE
jgi:hypothetical protein